MDKITLSDWDNTSEYLQCFQECPDLAVDLTGEQTRRLQSLMKDPEDNKIDYETAWRFNHPGEEY